MSLIVFATFLLSANAFYNFIPDDLATFIVPKNSFERFIENITAPTSIYAAYQVDEARETIDVSVKSPGGRTLHSRMNVTSGNFTLNVSELGIYEITFNNRRKKDILVTFAIDVYQSQKDEVTSRDIDPLEGDVDYIHKELSSLYFDHKFQQILHDTSTQQVKDANRRIYILTVVETIVIVGVTIWQIWYIKKLYNNRPSLLI